METLSSGFAMGERVIPPSGRGRREGGLEGPGPELGPCHSLYEGRWKKSLPRDEGRGGGRGCAVGDGRIERALG